MLTNEDPTPAGNPEHPAFTPTYEACLDLARTLYTISNTHNVPLIQLLCVASDYLASIATNEEHLNNFVSLMQAETTLKEDPCPT